jgi:hypothetical protein
MADEARVSERRIVNLAEKGVSALIRLPESKESLVGG